MCTGMEWLMVASTAVKTVGALNEGEQQKDYHNFLAAQAEADSQAEKEAGQVRARKVRQAGRAQRSEASAALAASGVEVGAGTALTIDQKIVRNTEEDALQEILTGERKGQRLIQQSQIERSAADRASAAGMRGALGSVLAGGAEIAKGWQQRPAPVEDRSPVRIR